MGFVDHFFPDPGALTFEAYAQSIEKLREGLADHRLVR